MTTKNPEEDPLEKTSREILEMLRGSSHAKRVHWSEFRARFCEQDGGAGLSNGELVQAMNAVLVPTGKVSGIDHNFFIGQPR